MLAVDGFQPFTIELLELDKCLDHPVNLRDDLWVEGKLKGPVPRTLGGLELAISKNDQIVEFKLYAPTFEVMASMKRTRRSIPDPPLVNEMRRGLRIEYGDGLVATVKRNGPRPFIQQRRVVVEGPDLRWTSTGIFNGVSMVDQSGHEIMRQRSWTCHVASMESREHLTLMTFLLFLKLPQSISLGYSITL